MGVINLVKFVKVPRLRRRLALAAMLAELGEVLVDLKKTCFLMQSLNFQTVQQVKDLYTKILIGICFFHLMIPKMAVSINFHLITVIQL